MTLRCAAAVRQLSVSLALSCSLIAGADAAAAEGPAAILQSASGTPTILELSNGELGRASTVGIGTRYRLPVQIKTGSADSAMLLLPNSVVDVSTNSLIRLLAPENAAPENHDGALLQRVLQQTGSTLFRVRCRAGERFQVETPFLVTRMNGAVFTVQVRDDGATVSLQEGYLEVHSLDASETVELAPGDVAFAGRDGELRMLELQVTSSGVGDAASALLGR